MPVIDIKQEERNVNFEVIKKIEDENIQKKCYIAELVRTSLDRFLDYDGLVANNSCSLYKLPIVNEETDIIDFEINSLSVHVVPTIGKSKNVNVYIPKDYKTYSCKPDIIVFVNFTKTLSKMTIVGYVTEFDTNNLSIGKNSLSSPDELILALKTLEPKKKSAEEGAINAAKELMLAYTSSSLSEEGHQFFLKHLISNHEIRKNYKLFYALNCKFICVAKSHSNLTDDNFVAMDSIPDEETYLTPEQVNESDNIITEDLPSDNTDISEAELQEDFPVTNEIDELSDIVDEPMLSDEDLPLVENIDISDEDFSLEDSEEELLSLQNETKDSEPDILSVDDESIELGLSDEDNEIVDISDAVVDEPAEEKLSLLDEPKNEEDIIASDDNVVDSDVLNFEENAEITSATEGSVQEEQAEESRNDEGDDLFSFLSEMADESQTESTSDESILQTEETLQEEALTENDLIKENQGNQDNQDNNPQPENADMPVENEDGGAQPDTDNEIPSSLDDAFSQSAETSNNFDTELTRETTTPKQSNAKNLVKPIAAALLLLIIAGGGLGFVLKDKISSFMNNESQDFALEDTKQGPKSQNDEQVPPPIGNLPTTNSANPQDTANVPPPIQQPNQGKNNMPTPPSPSSQQLPGLPTTVEPPKPKNINDALAIALTKDFSGVRISKISWEISETLLANEEVKRYLVIAGKSIKNALSKDLMAATEPSFKDNIVINITYKKDGNIAQVKIASSSGSSQIDEIAVKSVKDTLNYVKMPAINVNKPEYTAKLIVRL